MPVQRPVRTQLLPGNDVRVVLGANTMESPGPRAWARIVPGPQDALPIDRATQVDGLGGVLRPHDLVRVCAHEERARVPSRSKASVASSPRCVPLWTAPLESSVEVSLGVDSGLDFARSPIRGTQWVPHAPRRDSGSGSLIEDRVELGGGGESRTRYQRDPGTCRSRSLRVRRRAITLGGDVAVDST